MAASATMPPSSWTREQRDEIEKLRDDIETIKATQELQTALAAREKKEYHQSVETQLDLAPIAQTYATPVAATAISDATKSFAEIAELNQKCVAEKKELNKMCEDLAKQAKQKDDLLAARDEQLAVVAQQAKQKEEQLVAVALQAKQKDEELAAVARQARQKDERLAAMSGELEEERKQRTSLRSALELERRQRAALEEAKRTAEEAVKRREHDLQELRRRHNESGLVQQQNEAQALELTRIQGQLAEVQAHSELVEAKLREVSTVAAVKSPGDFLKMFRDTEKENFLHENAQLKLDLARVQSDRDKYMEAVRSQGHRAAK